MNPALSLNPPERAQRLDRLLEISRSLSTSELGPFLHLLISAASELTGCEAASVLELEEDGEQLHFLAFPWFYKDAIKSVKVPVRASVGGWVIQNGLPAVIPNAAADSRHFKGIDEAAGITTRSLMAVPIVYQGEKLGVLEAINKTGESPFDEEDRSILETLASHAAITIQNARLMARMQKSQDKMSQLDRMKSDFIAIASHELRTPLGLILGHATFLREVIPADYHSQLDIVVRNAMRLKDIIDNIASMDNAQRGLASLHANQISIKRVVEEVLDSFQQEANRKRLAMRCDMGAGDFLVDGDASKISIALSNLVKNAIMFTNPDGHIVIVVEQIPDHVKVSVIDDGVGIPSKDLPHIFERFYQVESHLTRKHGGMGLGLSVAKVMVEMHGGRIWAESVEGKGSNFAFILPVNSGQTAAVNNPPAS